VTVDVATGEIVPARPSAARTLDVLREQIAPKANDDELHWLAAVSSRLDLDPIAGHIVLIPRYDNRLGRDVHRPQITADGRLVLADRTGELEGFDGPEWTGPRNKDGSHTWLEVWDDEDPEAMPYAARVFVHRRGRSLPANGTVRWREFVQTDKAGKPLSTWAKMPSHMLGKVALSLGLRRAFPGILTGDDIYDDFVPFERERDQDPPDGQRTTGGGTSRNPPPRRVSTGPPPPSPAAADELVKRIGALSREDHHAFGEWQHSRRFSNAPAEWSSAVRGQIARELDRVEAQAKDDAEAYDDAQADE
jgi:hypothetical protein